MPNSLRKETASGITQERRASFIPPADAIASHRLSNVLELLLAHVVVDEIGPAAYLFIDLVRDADPSRLCEAFQAGSYVDAIAIDAAVIIDDIAQVDGYPVLHFPMCFSLGGP